MGNSTCDSTTTATMATELTVQSERAYQKQPHIFLNSKSKSKSTAVGKGGRRWVKDVGLGSKTPRTAIEGNYIDKKCPFTGLVSIRGRILTGTVVSTKMHRTLIIRREYLHSSPSTPVTRGDTRTSQHTSLRLSVLKRAIKLQSASAGRSARLSVSTFSASCPDPARL